MANENSNVVLTSFDKLFRQDAEVNLKNENVSAEMLKAFFDYDGPETVFDKVWISKFYSMESKTRGEHLRDLMQKLSPVEFESWIADSELDEKNTPDKKTATAYANRKVEAKKKIKAVENRIRRVIEALAFLRFDKIPTAKLQVKAGKVVRFTFVVDEETKEVDESITERAEWSMAELIKAGNTALTEETLKKKIEPRTPTASGKEAELVATISNDKSALVKVCQNLSRTLALAGSRDAYEGEAADALMGLAGEILRHFYSDDEGQKLDQEMILDWLDNVEAKVFASETTDTDEEKVA